MEKEQIYSKIQNQINQASHILMVTHQNPDGDALGSIFSFGWYLKDLNKKYTCFCRDYLPTVFNFLPHPQELENDVKIFQQNFDLLIVFDSSNLEYAGIKEMAKLLQPFPPMINIDHHLSNDYYGKINLVEAKAAATTEIIYHYFDYLRIKIDKNIATNLLTGIITDTGAFSNAATTGSSLTTASRLLINGANLRKITLNTLNNKPLSTLKLWGKVLSRLQRNEKLNFVSTIITQEDLTELKIDDEATEGIANFLNNLSEAKLVAVLKEEGGEKIKVSLRSTDDSIDVSRLANFFGGGGHKKAAGFSLKGRLQETKDGWEIV